MKILVYGNRKADDEFYDASTPEKENAAYLAIFKTLDQDWQVYEADELSSRHAAWLIQARDGNAESAKRLIKDRKNYEYENVREAKLIDATVAESER